MSRTQLRDLGFSTEQIDGRVRRGVLVPLHRGVYAVGHAHMGADARRLAAVLSLGPGAVLSHRTAGDHWAIRSSDSPRIEISVTSQNGRAKRADITVHRPSHLPPHHVTTHRGIPATTPARTLTDLASVLTPRQLESAVENTIRLGLFDLDAIGEALRGARGQATLRAVIESTDDVPPATKSHLERLFFRLCDEHAIPRPLVNTVVEGYEVDFVWPHASRIVETDGWDSHRTRAAFESDHERDLALDLAGYDVTRLTARQLRQPEKAARAVLQLLASADAGRS